MFIRSYLVAGLLLASPSGLFAQGAAKWGDLAMRFVYDGAPPRMKGAGGAGAIVDESLVVHPDDRGIQNIVAWLLAAEGGAAPVHPDYQKTAGDLAQVVIAGRFEPHIAIVRTTQTLAISNFDAAGYNVSAVFSRNQPFNVALKGGDTFAHQCQHAEPATAMLISAIQPIGGYLFVRDDPYAAASDAHGKLRIAKLAAGKWTFVVWHEKSGF